MLVVRGGAAVGNELEVADAVDRARVGGINTSGITIESSRVDLVVGTEGTTEGVLVDIDPAMAVVGGIFKVIQATTETIGPCIDDESPSTSSPPGTM